MSVTRRMLTCPPAPGRKAEGGLRTLGQYNKRRQAEGAAHPLVTVITVCLNAARTLEQCLRSVAGQTYDNLEHIVVDGGSSDGTLEILQRHAHAIDYFVSEPDGGLYQAMNKGLALAAGDDILILNADDWYAADCIESLVKAKGYGCADFVAALAQYVDGGGRPVRQMRRIPYDESVYLRMALRHETMLLPAALYDAVGGYDESYRIVADRKLAAALYARGCTVYEVPRALLYHRTTGISHSGKELLAVERARLVREHFPFLAGDEAAVFGGLGKLEPAAVRDLAARYRGEPRFNRALRAYCEESLPQALADWPEPDARGPLVSIVLPVYNAEKTLAESIDSVLAQTLRDFELLCIDDVSSDGSVALIERYRAADARVVLIRNERNIGHGATRNVGVRHARGEYIFDLDPDDLMPPGALEALVGFAREHGSEMVKGAYLREQVLFGAAPRAPQLKELHPRINTRLADSPDLLKTTEGHWSYLYQRSLSRRVPWPVDLKMGQDSIFIVRALVEARSVSVIGDEVYRYRANAASAMNTFTFRKYMDSLEWRRRAWHVLNDAALREIGDRLLEAYWSEPFFASLAGATSEDEFAQFCERLRGAFAEAGITPARLQTSPALARLFALVLAGDDAAARALLLQPPAARRGAPRPRGKAPAESLSVATFCSLDHGGAGTGSQRRIEALRAHGVDARLFCLVAKSGADYVKRITPQLPGLDSPRQRDVWEEAKARAIVRGGDLTGHRARELFSVAAGVLDFRDLADVFDEFDIVHLHWVVGMFDYDNAAEVLADKPVVWTLADMNAFTGGCHYSEGCDGYKRQCRRCPLLGGESDVAHENWKIKRRVYARLNNLHVICPSPWMAQRARESSLLGDKHIHYIPNAYPVERFAMTAKASARLRLGLPLGKKLLLFGAENLANHRKGGDLLREAVEIFSATAATDDVEVVVFGKNALEVGLPVHSLGYVEDDEMLALVYSAADAYLFPSREDNAPLTVGEALLCGTPVVAFPVGNVPSLLEHRVTGYVARHLDTADFADGIRWALDITRAGAFARSARCRMSAAQMHDPASAAARHESLYRLALGQVA